MTLDEVFANVAALPKPVREVHIVGGLHPDLPWSYFTDMMRGIKRVRPDIHIKAFTAVEIFFFHRLYRMSVEKVLAELKDAGPRLDARRRGRDLRQGDARQDHPGQGGRARSGWPSCARPTGMGIPTNATMLYGHVESVEDRVDHLLRLRELQDETGGFVTYIPLAFQPWEAPAMKLPGDHGLRGPEGHRGGPPPARQLPAHQVLLDHDRARAWRRSGLSFGADDIDGTVTEEKIAHDAGAHDGAGDDRARALPAHPRGGAAAHRARHRLQRGEGVVSALPTPEKDQTSEPQARSRTSISASVRLGVVSYLNVEPLIFGLDRRADAYGSNATCPRGWPSASTRARSTSA